MKVEIDIEDLRRLYDLATDSPLICSGSFETDDVRVLRRLGLKIGADLSAATPDEFVRDFPHEYIPATWHRFKLRIEYNQAEAVYFHGEAKFETEEEVMARLGTIPTGCVAGGYSRPCNREADHPIHQPGAPEPTSDPDAIDED